MTETHQKQFTGWWIPAKMVTLLESGVINCQELIIMANIGSLAESPRGCFASNEYLGTLVNVGGDRAKRMVCRLVNLGLLKRTVETDRTGKPVRYLEVDWDNYHPDDREDVDAEEEEPEREPRGRGKSTRETGTKRPVCRGENNPILDKSINKDYKSISSKELIDATTGRNKPQGEMDDFDDEVVKAGAYLFGVLIDKDDDLVHCHKNKKGKFARKAITRESCIKMMGKLKDERKVSDQDMWAFVKWYEKAYADVYTRRIRSLSDVVEEWGSYKDSMERWEFDKKKQQEKKINGHVEVKNFGVIDTNRFKRLAQDVSFFANCVGQDDPEAKVYRAVCRKWFIKNQRKFCYGLPTQEEFDVALAEYDLPPGFISPVKSCMREVGLS